MTDIEDSTKRLADIGDAAWDRLLERHESLTREVVDTYRGRVVDSTGDGFLLSFDGAARAVRAGVEICRAVSGIGLQVRVGVHTGEVEVVPGGLRGVTVHETARIMSLGRGGDVLLSDITKDLSQGAIGSYEDRGLHEMKGIPQPRRVYAVC